MSSVVGLDGFEGERDFLAGIVDGCFPAVLIEMIGDQLGCRAKAEEVLVGIIDLAAARRGLLSRSAALRVVIKSLRTIFVLNPLRCVGFDGFGSVIAFLPT